ncbi:MAG: YHS domain-containing protein [Candidatus Omnitrophota bacterium]
MKRTMIVLAAALILAGAVFYGSAYAECGSCAAGAVKGRAEEGGIINDRCPVMGNPVAADTPYTAEYEGKKVGFCCEGCVSKFNSDPGKYTKNLLTDDIKG